MQGTPARPFAIPSEVLPGAVHNYIGKETSNLQNSYIMNFSESPFTLYHLDDAHLDDSGVAFGQFPTLKKVSKRFQDGIDNPFAITLNSLMQRRPAVIIILHLELRALVTHDNQDVLDHLLGAILGGHMQPDGGQNVPAHLLLHVGDGVIGGEGKHPLMLIRIFL